MNLIGNKLKNNGHLEVLKVNAMNVDAQLMFYVCKAHNQNKLI